MLNCAPTVRAATSKYILSVAQHFSDNRWKNLLARPLYVHWQTLINNLQEITISESKVARRILKAWEEDLILPIPDGDNMDELPSIVSLNTRFPDNVRVLCQTVGEYVNLRKSFGKEDIGGFTLDEI